MLALIFFSGTFVPVEELPGWMQVGAFVNPLHYSVDAMRQIYIPDPAAADPFIYAPAASLAVEAAVIALVGVVFAAGAVWAFSRES